MYTVKEVAKIFNVSRQTIIRWIRSGHLKAVRVVREYRITEEEIERLKNDNEQAK